MSVDVDVVDDVVAVVDVGVTCIDDVVMMGFCLPCVLIRIWYPMERERQDRKQYVHVYICTRIPFLGIYLLCSIIICMERHV